MLIEEYKKLFQKVKNSQDKVINILFAEGKEIIVDNIRKTDNDIETILNKEDYYLTNIDIFILANNFEFPLIVISDKPILLENNKDLFVMNHSNNTEGYYMIKWTKPNPNVRPVYRLLQKSNEELLFKPEELSQKVQSKIKLNHFSLEDYINRF